MAGIFLVFLLAIIFCLFNKRLLAMSTLALGLCLTLLMFWYHATDVLKINW